MRTEWTRDWPNSTKAPAQLPAGEDGSKVMRLLREMLGTAAIPEDVSHLVGALDDAVVCLAPSPGAERIEVRIQHADFEHWERHLCKDKLGKVHLWNEKIRIRPEKQGGGIGADRLRIQVENAFHAGVAYIACHAARVNAVDPRRGFIGYFLWPRYGFDQTLEALENGTVEADDLRKGTPAAFPAVVADIRKEFGNDVKSIQDLLEKEGGFEWWKANGVELYHAVFDLTEGSRSLEVFNEYWLAKKGAPLCLKNPM